MTTDDITHKSQKIPIHARSLSNSVNDYRAGVIANLCQQTEMPRKYIVVEFGMPYTAELLPDITRPRTRLAVIARTWEHQHVFDESSRYQCVVTDPPEFGFLSRMLAHTVYNPFVSVASHWVRCGNYSKRDLITLVDLGLREDDDIIQQWFGADEVLKLLNAATTWDQMTKAVDAIGGSHEVDNKVLKYVESVLGSRA